MAGINRTLRWLRGQRAKAEPELYEYDPTYSDPPLGTRYVTLAEAQSLECNMCGQCCGSHDADTADIRDYTFGGIRKNQWANMNGGEPLIIPLTATGKPRAWREKDEDVDTAPPFMCAALAHVADGTTRCTIWQGRRPPPCDTFPVKEPRYPRDLGRGAYILLNTKYQRLCTWVDMLLCPADSVFLEWRKADGTLPFNKLTSRQRAYVREVFAEAYRDAYPMDEMMSLSDWRKVRRTEAQWREVPSS